MEDRLVPGFKSPLILVKIERRRYFTKKSKRTKLSNTSSILRICYFHFHLLLSQSHGRKKLHEKRHNRFLQSQSGQKKHFLTSQNVDQLQFFYLTQCVGAQNKMFKVSSKHKKVTIIFIPMEDKMLIQQLFFDAQQVFLNLQ